VGNIIIMLVMLLVPFVIFTRFLAVYVPDMLRGPIYVAIILLAILATFFLYNVIMEKFAKKVDMAKYFHPILKPRKK
jgi:hypothetical protein